MRYPHSQSLRKDLEMCALHFPGDHRIVVPWSVHRAMPLSAVRGLQAAVGDAHAVFLHRRYNILWDPGEERGEEPSHDQSPPSESERCLTRQYVDHYSRALLVVDGGLSHQDSSVVEDVSRALSSRHPIYLASGVGGVTRLISSALAAEPRSWERGEDIPDDLDVEDSPLRESLVDLNRCPFVMPGQILDWNYLNGLNGFNRGSSHLHQFMANGLLPEETEQLEHTVNGRVVASLAVRGLARWVSLAQPDLANVHRWPAWQAGGSPA